MDITDREQIIKLDRDRDYIVFLEYKDYINEKQVKASGVWENSLYEATIKFLHSKDYISITKNDNEDDTSTNQTILIEWYMDETIRDLDKNNRSLTATLKKSDYTYQYITDKVETLLKYMLKNNKYLRYEIARDSAIIDVARETNTKFKAVKRIHSHKYESNYEVFKSEVRTEDISLKDKEIMFYSYWFETDKTRPDGFKPKDQYEKDRLEINRWKQVAINKSNELRVTYDLTKDIVMPRQEDKEGIEQLEAFYKVIEATDLSVSDWSLYRLKMYLKTKNKQHDNLIKKQRELEVKEMERSAVIGLLSTEELTQEERQLLEAQQVEAEETEIKEKDWEPLEVNVDISKIDIKVEE